MAKKDKNKTAFFILLAVIILASAVLFYNKIFRCPECEVCPEEKSMLNTDMYDWGTNEYNESEFIFGYWIYNYGNVEAKNITVKCKLVDINDNVKVSATDNFGDLASNSADFGQVVTTNPYLAPNAKFTARCYVESCTNCEILYHKIPGLIKSFEG